MNATDDEKLVRQYQQGNRNAFEILFQRYYQYVYKIFIWKGIAPPEAEDFTQDLFLRLTTALLNFAGKSSFKTYLDRAVTNKLIDFYRERRERALPLNGGLLELLESDSEPASRREKMSAHLFEATTPATAIREALTKCLEKETRTTCRAVLALWLDGFKLRQIASILSLPLGTVNSHLTRGRARLRRCMEKKL
jgi:RNA polymerase sigma-70 factor (ECF subfamily)